MRTANLPVDEPRPPLPAERIAEVPDGTPPDGKDWGHRLATAGSVLVPAAVMLRLGLWGLDRGTMWRDESATYQIARRSLPEILRMLGSLDAVHGLYYLVMHAVLAVRADEVTLRMPSVIAGACTAGLVAAIGCRLARPRVGLWAGLLYAATPFATHYAQEGRSYALVAAGAALATWCLLVAVERRAVRWWAAYVAAVVITGALHEFALLMLVAHGTTMLFTRPQEPVRRAWAKAAGTAVALLLPLVVLSSLQSAQISWIQEPGPKDLGLLALQFAGPGVPVLTASLVLALTGLLRRLPRTGPVGLTAVALPLALLPVVLLFLVSQVKPVFVDRYLFFAFAGVPLLVAAGLERLLGILRAALWRPVVTTVGVAAIAAMFWCQLPFHEKERRKDSRIDDLRAVAAHVAAEARPEDAVVYVPAYQRHISLTYTREFAGLRDTALKSSAAASGTLYGEEFDGEEIAKRLSGEKRVWVVAWPGAWDQDWFREDPKMRALQRGFQLVRSTQLKSGLVQLYVRARPR
ncbi:glycosyltransferase family 39 protein [Streptomyces phyllanthi]|uniref:Glycosyltransferase RgtA/B/C/D-like domain-containing protein n=1 Tax=Streptomyces phyllanthi TaxID=1803180 RepID=A0A5N8WAV8_9ACTN|nr:glycosyltransferase family 39 protein [Streptomyces phyllanthi]MPY44623.1 hypothetical protein [Streptomyces phyllanthi]